MSREAIAALLARDDLPCGERLVAFSLASFAGRDARTLVGTPAAARRAGLKRSWFLEARELLERRGLVVVEQAATGRGRASTLWLPFAEAGPWWDGDINAELFEAALSYSPAKGAARLLLAAAAALAAEERILEGVTTRQLCAAAGLSETTYRRARTWLLASGELMLRSGSGGRGKANCWEIADPRACVGEAAPVGRRRVAPPAGQRPLLASVSSAAATTAQERPGSEVDDVDSHAEDRIVEAVRGGGDRAPSARNRPVGGGVSRGKGAAGRTHSGHNRPVSGGVSLRKGAAGRTVSSVTPPQTPPETPPPNARAGREPKNPRASQHPPTPLKGGSAARSVLIEETYLTERGRKRKRHVRVDLEEIRRRLGLPTAIDHEDWGRTGTLLRNSVGESVFAIWLEPIKLIAIDSQGALVIAPPPATRDWVQKRFGRLLSDCARRASRELRFVDDGERAAFGSHDDRRPTTGDIGEFTTTQRRVTWSQ
jgi:hypothetical protein